MFLECLVLLAKFLERLCERDFLPLEPSGSQATVCKLRVRCRDGAKSRGGGAGGDGRVRFHDQDKGSSNWQR